MCNRRWWWSGLWTFENVGDSFGRFQNSDNDFQKHRGCVAMAWFEPRQRTPSPWVLPAVICLDEAVTSFPFSGSYRRRFPAPHEWGSNQPPETVSFPSSPFERNGAKIPIWSYTRFRKTSWHRAGIWRPDLWRENEITFRQIIAIYDTIKIYVAGILKY